MANRPHPPRVIAMVAGAASGDQLGAHLMRSLKAREPGLEFIGIGGPRMEAAGAHTLYPMEKLAARGYIDGLRHYWEWSGIRRRLRDYLLGRRPALFIGVDAAEFNVDLEIELKSAGIPTVQYVNRAVWASPRERLQEAKRAVSLMLAAFPFEAALYRKAGVPVEYIGHPLADLLAELPTMHAVREELHVPQDELVVALLPGSRVTELKHTAELFVRAAMKITERVPGVRFLAPFASLETKAIFEIELARANSAEINVTLLIAHSLEAMAAADVVLVTSGTASLEAALLKRPMVIAYRTAPLAWRLLRPRNGLPFVGMPNILSGGMIVPELVQDAATPESLSDEVVKLLCDEDAYARLDRHFEAIRQALRQNTAEKAASAIMPLIGGARAP